jgi:hypothetical protein
METLKGLAAGSDDGQKHVSEHLISTADQSPPRLDCAILAPFICQPAHVRKSP